MKTKLLTSLLLVFVLGTPAYAQEDWFFGVAYETSLASGTAADFASPFSWRGASFTGRRAVRDNFTVGFLTGWHVMNDEGVASTSLDDQGLQQGLDITGYTLRYINSFPIMASFFWYSGMPGGSRLYLGGNLGGYYIERRVEVNVFAISRERLHFGAAPEVGIVTPLGWRGRGFAGARYNWAASSGGSGDITYWNFFVGVAWQ
ncbi:MAG: hypothetical protein PVI01_15220 [Gemmatimonadales bacterium]|jgi:hypothetical protein